MKFTLLVSIIIFSSKFILAQSTSENKNNKKDFSEYLGDYEPIRNKEDRIWGHILLKANKYFISFSKQGKYLPEKEIKLIKGLSFKTVDETLFLEFCQNQEKKSFLIIKEHIDGIELEMIKSEK